MLCRLLTIHNWRTSGVKEAELANDPHCSVPGFHLPGSLWTILNRIKTEKGRRQYLLHKWDLTETQNCERGSVQTVRHTIKVCPKTRFGDGLEKLHAAEVNSIKWPNELQICL